MRLSGHPPLEYAEAALILLGIAVTITAVFNLVRRGTWCEIFTLRAIPTTSFSALDLLGYFLLTNVIGMLCLSLLPSPLPTSAPVTSQPDPPVANAPATAAAGLLVPTSGALLILALTPLRVRGRFRGFGLDASSWRRAVFPALLWYLAIWPFCAGALVLTRSIVHRFAPEHHFDEHSTLNLLRLAGEGPAWVRIFLVLGAVIAAPLAEELLFRGMILTMLQRASGSPWIAVLGAAAIFAAFHWSNPDAVLPLFIFGSALGVAFARSGSLAVPIVMHVCFNAKTILWLMLGAPA